MGQTQEPPQLERLIVYRNEWLQSLGSLDWNEAYETEQYYSKTHILQGFLQLIGELLSC